jgi:hypothetical protein
VAYALAKAEQRRAPLLDLAVAHTSAGLASLSPDGLVNLAWALAQLRHSPGEEWLRGFLLASGPQQVPGWKAGLLVNALWALGRLQAGPHDAWMEGALQVGGAGGVGGRGGRGCS